MCALQATSRKPCQESSSVVDLRAACSYAFSICVRTMCTSHTSVVQQGVCFLQVYLASASPPVRFPNVYGVDLPTKKEFVATDLTEDEICKVSAHLHGCLSALKAGCV